MNRQIVRNTENSMKYHVTDAMWRISKMNTYTRADHYVRDRGVGILVNSKNKVKTRPSCGISCIVFSIQCICL